MQRCGMKVKDYIVGIGSVDTKWAKHDEVVKLVRQANLTLKLVLITPVPKPEASSERAFSTINLPTSPVKVRELEHICNFCLFLPGTVHL